MLGRLVYESKGKVVTMKRLPNGSYELATKARGKFLGNDFSYEFAVETGSKSGVTEHIVFTGVSRVNGLMLPFSGIGNGIRKSDGTMIYLGAASYSSPPGE